MSDPAADDERAAPATLLLIQREVVLLVALSLIAVAMFIVTARLAAWSHRTSRDEAAVAFARGEQLRAEHRNDDAVVLFERALNADPSNRAYALALARTLADQERGDEASRILIRLREADPDDIDVNYRLARWAASSGDVAAAVRYYNHALYGIDRTGSAPDRRLMRAELIGLLLDHNDFGGARVEIAALERELPDDPGSQLAAGRVAARAQDWETAWRLFARAATLDPSRAEAALGAGTAAMNLGRFHDAAQSLEAAQRLGLRDVNLTPALDAAERADALNPLSAGLDPATRSRRVHDGVTWAVARLAACAPLATSPDAVSLRPTLASLATQAPAALRDTDTLATAVSAIGRTARLVAASCPPPTPDDRAWSAISAAGSDTRRGSSRP